MLWWKIYTNKLVSLLKLWHEKNIVYSQPFGGWEVENHNKYTASVHLCSVVQPAAAQKKNTWYCLYFHFQSTIDTVFTADTCLCSHQIFIDDCTAQSLKWPHLFATESEFVHSLSGHVFTVPSLNTSATRFNLVFSKASDQP